MRRKNGTKYRPHEAGEIEKLTRDTSLQAWCDVTFYLPAQLVGGFTLSGLLLVKAVVIGVIPSSRGTYLLIGLGLKATKPLLVPTYQVPCMPHTRRLLLLL